MSIVFGLRVLLLSALTLVLAGDSTSEGKAEFARDVAPLLTRACVTCHSGPLSEGGLSLTSRAAVLQGGDSGPALVPGDPAQSLLLKRVAGTVPGFARMPKDLPPLSDAEVAILRQWVVEGAPWPEGMAGAMASLSGPVETKAALEQKHWAYVKPERPNPPAVKDKTWVRNPIDAFVLARLQNEGLLPSPEASRETLLRRVSLDLTGLPPTLLEVDAFVADASPDAYEKVVGRLLASPHYGEHGARLWLDLARYADTNGYERDRRRVAWKFRDWTINALNADMPFRQFTVEQIAGDMLKDATMEQKIATGFHRNTLLNQEGGIDVEEARFETLVDRVNTTASVWLGSTMGCAQCHNHKYDPFSQRDYYKMMAFFDNADYRIHGVGERVMDKWIVEPDLEIATPEEAAKRKALRSEADALRPYVEGRDVEAELFSAPRASRPAEHRKDLVSWFRPGAPSLAAARDRLVQIDRELVDMKIVTAQVMSEKPGSERPSTPLRIRGSFVSPGERQYASTPSFLPGLPERAPANRLGLALWLVDEENPLTARVTVNRLWEQIFGRGLVLTSEDFGTQGEPPSHPELLDWLATEFVRQDWSLKKIQRLMVTSATYRQSSWISSALNERDPYNRLLARGPRFRVDAEAVRDITLSVSGLLSPKIGGPSVFPEQPDGVWDNPYSSDKWTKSDGEDRYRRSLYTFIRRTAPYPMLTTFDAPSREFCTVRRTRTNTPLQALATLNDPAFFEAARALAGRVLDEAGPRPEDRALLAFRLSTARKPSPDEIAPLLRFYREQAARFAADPAAAAVVAGVPPDQRGPTVGNDGGAPTLAERAAWTMVANVVLNLDETLTKE